MEPEYSSTKPRKTISEGNHVFLLTFIHFKLAMPCAIIYRTHDQVVVILGKAHIRVHKYALVCLYIKE